MQGVYVRDSFVASIAPTYITPYLPHLFFAMESSNTRVDFLCNKIPTNTIKTRCNEPAYDRPGLLFSEEISGNFFGERQMVACSARRQVEKICWQ